MTRPYYLQPSATSQFEKAGLIALRNGGVNIGAIFITWEDYGIKFYRNQHTLDSASQKYAFLVLG